jgi:hydrogenase nickel incorporation protein HypB
MNSILEPSMTPQSPGLSQPLVVLLSGTSGCGKTSLVRAAGTRLHDRGKMSAVVATPAAAQAQERLSGCVSSLHFVSEDHLDYETLEEVARSTCGSLLLVETVEPLKLPTEARDTHKQVAVFSTSAGNDKVFEYPRAVATADLVVLTKADLLPHVPFDLAKFTAAIRQLNPIVPIITVSALRGAGMDAWENWLRAQLEQQSKKAHRAAPAHSEWFVG